MFCAISGVSPEDPVVSKKSGLLFEKRLVQQYIAEHGSDPVTGVPLAEDDLLPIKSNKAVKPRPLQAASIPGMLHIFQNEWDSHVLGSYALEQQLHTVRQELSHALYQARHDAACRVIARLKKERDEARALLSANAHVAFDAQPVPMIAANGKREVDDEVMRDGDVAAKKPQGGITEEIVAALTDCNARLSSARKKRQIPATLAAPEALEAFTQLSSHPLHKTNKPGILSLDIDATKDLILTGGIDSSAVVFDRASGEIKASLAGHTKRVTSVRFVPEKEYLLTASADKTVRIWKEGEEGAYECKHVLTEHTAEVKSCTVHATNDYFVSVSADRSWCFYEVQSGLCLTQVMDPTVEDAYTVAAFHPDGLILGTGTAESAVRIWDVKNQEHLAKFEGHSGPVTGMSFSENGYFLATAAMDGVKLWDLRKLRNFRSFAPYDANTPTNAVAFDHSGSYLAIAGADIRIYQVGTVKQEWNVIKTIPDLSGTGVVTDIKFGPNASYLAVATKDRNLRLLGSTSTQAAES
eukprot:SM000004S14917  [mRNA]  locus=s4:227863:232784:+ [translate_table: standard]